MNFLPYSFRLTNLYQDIITMIYIANNAYNKVILRSSQVCYKTVSMYTGNVVFPSSSSRQSRVTIHDVFLFNLIRENIQETRGSSHLANDYGSLTTNPDFIFTLLLQLALKIQMTLYYFRSR